MWDLGQGTLRRTEHAELPSGGNEIPLSFLIRRRLFYLDCTTSVGKNVGYTSLFFSVVLFLFFETGFLYVVLVPIL